MDEFVVKPREFCGIEKLPPAMRRTLDAAATGMRKAKYRMADATKKVSFSCQVRSRAASISKSSMRLRTPSMESSSRSAADRKLPRCTTSIKTLAASRSVRQSRAALSRSSWGTPLSGARCIQDPFRLVNWQNIEVSTTMTGSGPRDFDVLADGPGRCPRNPQRHGRSSCCLRKQAA